MNAPTSYGERNPHVSSFSHFPIVSQEQWGEAPTAEWNDWHWQLKHRITTMEELEKRIRGRRTEAEDVIKERLDKARREIATKDQYKHVVVNDDVMRAKDDIVKIIEENMK